MISVHVLNYLVCCQVCCDVKNGDYQIRQALTDCVHTFHSGSCQVSTDGMAARSSILSTSPWMSSGEHVAYLLQGSLSESNMVFEYVMSHLHMVFEYAMGHLICLKYSHSFFAITTFFCSYAYIFYPHYHQADMHTTSRLRSPYPGCTRD
jgi:hypothetical protein